MAIKFKPILSHLSESNVHRPSLLRGFHELAAGFKSGLKQERIESRGHDFIEPRSAKEAFHLAGKEAMLGLIAPIANPTLALVLSRPGAIANPPMKESIGIAAGWQAANVHYIPMRFAHAVRYLGRASHLIAKHDGLLTDK